MANRNRHQLRDRYGRFARAVPAPPVVVVLRDPLRFPTVFAPRFRLRVFDLRWPWRASQDEVLRDALVSRNAWRDPDTKKIWLDACANVQQDPPPGRDRSRPAVMPIGRTTSFRIR